MRDERSMHLLQTPVLLATNLFSDCNALIDNQIRPKFVTVAVNVAPQLVR